MKKPRNFHAKKTTKPRFFVGFSFSGCMSADARARSTRRREPAARPARGGSAHGLGLKVFGLFQASYKIHVCVYIYIYMLYLFMCLYMYIYLYLCLYFYFRIYFCIDTYVCVCVYAIIVCICIYSCSDEGFGFIRFRNHVG